MFDRDALSQIVEGLTFLHSNGIAHGNLLEKSIVLQQKSYKISMFEATGGSYKDDVRALGAMIGRNSRNAEHLVKCLTSEIDDEVPDASEILYHPFFWGEYETATFFALAYFYPESVIGSDLLVCKKHVCVKHRDILQVFANAYVVQDSKELTKLCAMYCRRLPQLTLLTWLKLQSYKKEGEIYHFYSNKYNWSPRHGPCDSIRCLDVKQKKRVRFSKALEKIRLLEDDELHRQARIGTWVQDGRRFSKRIQDTGVILEPMLTLKLLAMCAEDPIEKYSECIYSCI